MEEDAEMCAAAGIPVSAYDAEITQWALYYRLYNQSLFWDKPADYLILPDWSRPADQDRLGTPECQAKGDPIVISHQ